MKKFMEVEKAKESFWEALFGVVMVSLSFYLIIKSVRDKFVLAIGKGV